jgi:hypothetical protein
MAAIGIFATVNDEVGHIIVADVARDTVRTLAQPDSDERERLITRAG